MFIQESKEIEQAYRDEVSDLQEEIEEWDCVLLYYMQEFVSMHKEKDLASEKLDALLKKLGRKA